MNSASDIMGSTCDVVWSVPGAVATGSQHSKRTWSRGRDPVATAPGTDLTISSLTLSGEEFHALRRSQQVHLELNAENIRAGRHQSKGSVTTSGIGDGRHHAGVQVTMLLGQISAIRKRDFNDSRPNQRKPGADQIHDWRLGKAAGDVCGER